jgi:hypothetical protein
MAIFFTHSHLVLITWTHDIQNLVRLVTSTFSLYKAYAH